MNRILELKQKRAASLAAAAAVLEPARAASRALTPEESVSYDRAFGEANAFRTTIEAEERQATIDADIEEQRTRREDLAHQGIDPDTRDREGKTVAPAQTAFRKYLRYGVEGLEQEQRSMLQVGNQFAPDFRALNQSVLTGNLGGFVVPQGFYASVINALKYYAGVIESEPTVLNTSMGNDLPVPTSNDTSNMGRILGEGSPAAVLEVTFGQVILKAFKYTSDIIAVPIELLQDTGVDIEALITAKIAERLGRIQNLHFTTGDGNGKPRGILIDTVLGKTGAAGQTATIIYDDIVDLKYSVNRAYRRNAKFMMADTVLQAILKLKDSNNRPLILDYLATLQAGEPEKLLGQNLVVNNDMPGLGITGSPAVGNQSLLYGDFSNYWVRRVMAMLLLRLTERYAEQGLVAFLAFMRTDGRMVDAGTHPIKAYVNATS